MSTERLPPAEAFYADDGQLRVSLDANLDVVQTVRESA
ncbi:MAG: hypothetical protein ACI8UR_000297 [Natronomonas sp.]|jgi:hypothetical protein